ncbi:hypothetical protein BMS3Abin14_00739 [bacterium BMS3Abin14]|nr:hypothetical protein BMS3Abin14_00739 [bacterium BMS3Abin14]
MILPPLIGEHQVTAVVGPRGISKTYFCMALAKALAGGGQFLGFQAERRPVFWINFEMYAGDLASRFRNAGLGEGVFLFHPADGPPPKLDSTAWDQVERSAPEGSVIIIDSLRAAQGLRENTSEEMSGVIHKLLPLREKGFTIILIAHTGKGSQESIRGSQAIEDQVDSILIMQRTTTGNGHGDLADGQTKLGIHTTKSRRGVPVDLKLIHHWEDGSFELLEDESAGQLELVGDLIVDLGEEAIHGRLVEKIMASLGVSRSKSRWLLKQGENRLWTAGKRPPFNSKHYTLANEVKQ